MEKDKKVQNDVYTCLSCCLFMLGMYKKAEEIASKGEQKFKFSKRVKGLRLLTKDIQF